MAQAPSRTCYATSATKSISRSGPISPTIALRKSTKSRSDCSSLFLIDPTHTAGMDRV